MDEDILLKLEQRLGRLHARQRLGIESEHEAKIFGQGLNFFHIENWYSVHSLIRNALRLAGLYRRGQRNAERIIVKHNDIDFEALPPLFNGFTILHLSDLHVDMNEGAMRRLGELVDELEYDLCVLTGDYRGKTFGSFAATVDGIARVRAHLKEPIYGVLGNHDSIRMAPAMEAISDMPAMVGRVARWPLEVPAAHRPVAEIARIYRRTVRQKKICARQAWLTEIATGK